jgi:4-coumarate--CoA ligase
MLTHRNIVANTMMIKAAEAGKLQPTGGPTGEGDKLLAFLPFFHIYGTLNTFRVTRKGHANGQQV